MNVIQRGSESSNASSLAVRLRAWVRGCAWAFSVFILVAWFTLDRYEVRGNSMQPLLIDRSPNPDQIVAWKPYYKFFEPKRFDLVIFERPSLETPGVNAANISNDRCIKRIFGLAGERPWIDGGDFFLAESSGAETVLRRVRRPARVIESMLVEVARFSSQQQDEREWQFPASAQREGTSLVLDSSRNGEQAAIVFDSLVRNDWTDDSGRKFAGGDIVNDVGLEVECSFVEAVGQIAIELREQGDLFRARFDAAGRLEVERRRGPAAEWQRLGERTDLPSTGPRNIRLKVMNVDDEILVWIDGSVVLKLDYDGNEEVIGPWSNGPRVVVVAGSVRFDSMTVWRDPYFTTTGVATGVPYLPKTIPADSYFCLGDNSSNSIDSRDFGAVARSALEGRPWLRFRSEMGFSEL